MPSFQETRRMLITIAAVLTMAFAGTTSTAHADEISNNGGNNNDGDGIVNS